MEPRSFDRGNPRPATVQRTPEAELQWSRDLSIAETISASCSIWSGVRLQWSRDLSIAETVAAVRI